MAGHFIGKFIFNRLIDIKVADVDYPTETKKCLIIPINDNGIRQWNGEWEMWFRALRYHNPKGKFTHFLMKYIPISSIKNLSQRQIEAFANHSIGNMMRSKYHDEERDIEKTQKEVSETSEVE